MADGPKPKRAKYVDKACAGKCVRRGSSRACNSVSCAAVSGQSELTDEVNDNIKKTRFMKWAPQSPASWEAEVIVPQEVAEAIDWMAARTPQAAARQREDTLVKLRKLADKFRASGAYCVVRLACPSLLTVAVSQASAKGGLQTLTRK